MTSENSSALNRYYYPLSEAAKVLKARGKGLSVYDLLHYGVQGVVRLFIHLPSGMRVRRILGSVQYENEPQPSLLILSRLQCGEIECNKTTRHSDFPSAYANLYSYLEIPLYPKDPEFLEEMHWQAIDSNDEITPIQITPKLIHLAHTELTQLIELLDRQYRPPVKFSPRIEDNLQKEIELRCYSLETAVEIAKEKNIDLTANDLLRYGYYENLTFVTPCPNNLGIVVVNVPLEGPSTIVGHTLSPDMLALDADDCYKIEIFGHAERSDYKTGFLCIFRPFTLKTLIPHPPSEYVDSISERVDQIHSLTPNNFRLRAKNSESCLRWRTNHNSNVFPLKLRKDNLFVLRSEFDSFINAASISRDTEESRIEYTPKFTIPDVTRYHLSPKNFITLSEAAKLAKCSEKQVLSEGARWPNIFLTPVPCEIALCQALANLPRPKKSQSSFPENVEEIPQLLVLDETDCEALADLGHHKQGSFKLGYSFEKNQRVQRVPNYFSGIIGSNQDEIRRDTAIQSSTINHDGSTSVWLTFYQDKPIKIEINFDRVFIALTASGLPYFLERIRRNQSKHQVNQIPPTASEPAGVDNAIASAIADNETAKTNQSLETTNPVSSDAPVERVTEKEFMELSGRSRTTIDNKSKDRVKYPDFPRKIPDEDNVHVHFLRPEVDAWLRKNPPRKRKEK